MFREGAELVRDGGEEAVIDKDGKLLVFENFVLDWELAKHKKPTGKIRYRKYSSGEEGEPENESDMSFSDSESSHPLMTHPSRLTVSLVPFDGIAWWRRLFNWLSSPFGSKTPAQLPAPELSIEEFFSSVKHSAQEITVVKKRAAGYEKAIANARAAGQKALVEQLDGGLNAYKMETHLLALGLKKFISEESIVDFYKKSKRGLRLDWVRNFSRTIPEDIVAKKARCDELGIFDNYCVLHYDPGTKSFAETRQEKAARKDPILFGLMRDRRVLYVIGDWVDEVCDLTLDQLAEVLGSDPVKEIQ